MQELKIDDRVIYKVLPDRELYVKRFEPNYPDAVVLGEKGKRGQFLKNAELFTQKYLVKVWSEVDNGEANQ